MNAWSRLGTGFLGVAGLLVVSLMGYTLFFTGEQTSGRRGGVLPGVESAARVAIFLPNRSDWTDFHEAAAACERRNLIRLGPDHDGTFVVESVGSGRRIQFERHDVRGISDTRDDVRRLKNTGSVPIAVVGSTTSVLTVAIAESLRAEGDHGPILAIPWATSVQVQRLVGGSEASRRDLVPLIEIDSGRTFRFCPNNHQLADSVVDCLVARDDGRLPGRVFLVVDPFDPYSDDLATCFRQAIRARKPDVEIVERADAVDLPTFARPLDASPEPSSTEIDLADAIVSSQETGDLRPTWVVLPLQDQPARHMIAALRRRSAWPSSTVKGRGPLRVVCGDAIERQALHDLAGQGGLSIWCASTSSTGPLVSDDTQALAEIVSALVWAVDHAPAPTITPDQVRDAWRSIDLPAHDAASLGRALAFEPNGERRGDPGRVLAIQPDAAVWVEYARSSTSGWQPVDLSAPVTPR